MKECIKCFESRPLQDFCRGRNHCKVCERDRNRRRRLEKNPNLIRTKAFYVKVPVGYKYCPSCELIKSLDDFYLDNSRKSGRSSRCIDCERIRVATYASSDNGKNKRRITNSLRRARRKSTVINCTKDEELKFIMDHLFCFRCGSAENLELDHIIPLTWGILSRHSLDNFQILCKSCNASKGDRYSIDFSYLNEYNLLRESGLCDG